MEQQKTIPAGPEWVEKSIQEFPGFPPKRIGEEWMLITAGYSTGEGGGSNRWNTMTASWGGLGVLWTRDVAFVFVRPTRHSYDFFNKAELFCLSFFEPAWHKALEFCGTKSGRDYDKARETGLSPIMFTGGRTAGGVGFQEATENIICRKLYTHDFDPARFLDPSIEALYPQKDYHRMFIGETLGLRVREP